MNVRTGFIMIPEEVCTTILCYSGLDDLRDLGNCLRVSKLFNQIIASSPVWENWAVRFYPDKKWDDLKTSHNFTWYGCVIKFKNDERNLLNLINYLNENINCNSFSLSQLIEHLKKNNNSLNDNILEYLKDNNVELKEICNNLLETLITHFSLSDNLETNHIIGDCFHYGIAVDKNSEKGFQHYKIAAEKGMTKALRGIAVCYLTGSGCKKDESAAFKYYQQAADQGDAMSLHNMGYFFENGFCCTPDLKKALEYYELAGKQKIPMSLIRLGNCYLKGQLGCTIDSAKGFQYYEKAALEGDLSANFYIGFLHFKGAGSQASANAAFSIIEQAALKGNPEAQCYLGIFYAIGTGCSIDTNKAFYFVNQSAHQENSDGLFVLGTYYEIGLGCEKDLDKAHAFYFSAMLRGHEKAKQNYYRLDQQQLRDIFLKDLILVKKE